MEFVKHRDFAAGIHDLQRWGGKFQKAASQANELLGRISNGDPSPLKGLRETKYGESRIKNCIKYDLTGFARLVTFQKGGKCILLFVGTHEHVDAWLDKNRGTEYKVDKDGQPIETMQTLEEGGRGHWHEVKPIQGDVFRHLPADVWERLVAGCRKLERKQLEALRAGDYDDLHEACDDMSNPEQAEAIRSVFISLMDDQIEKSINTALSYLGEVVDIDQVETLVDTDKFSVIRPGDPDYAERVSRLLSSDDYRQWMLFMHPEQLRIAVERFSGSAKISGVSGSGKTCTVVRRAIELAARYPGKRVLVLTLNRPLARLIDDLVEVASPVDLRCNIRVAPLFEVCQEILLREEPSNEKLYDDKTWKSTEHVDEIWREFYRCELSNHSAACMQPVHDSLISRGIDAENYIRQEFDWIRSAFCGGERSQYLEVERRGRKHPLPKHFRKMLLDGLDAWEEKMRFVGVTDYLGVTTAASVYLDRISPEYRCIIVDECQDFGTTELVIVRRLCEENEDDILLCGDAAQQVSSKAQSVQAAGISIHSSRIRKLEKNYRNSRDILDAAYQVLVSNISEDIIDNLEFDLLDPKFADFSGSSPVVLMADNLNDELANSLQYIRDESKGRPSYRGLIAVCGFSMYELEKYSEKVGLPVLSPDMSIGDHPVVLSDLEQSKGFEFDVVCILNCRDGVLPDSSVPKDEQFRDLARFYVAMTRAKSSLILSWSHKISPFLEGLDNKMLYGDWSDFVDEVDQTMPDIDKLSVLRDPDGLSRPLGLMSGPEFLYQEHALGLPQNAIEQVRKYITGKSVVRGKQKERVEWADIGTAYRDMNSSALARGRFGPETSASLLELLSGVLGKKSGRDGSPQ